MINSRVFLGATDYSGIFLGIASNTGDGLTHYIETSKKYKSSIPKLSHTDTFLYVTRSTVGINNGGNLLNKDSCENAKPYTDNNYYSFRSKKQFNL